MRSRSDESESGGVFKLTRRASTRHPSRAVASQYKEYRRALEWGWPAGMGWRPLDLFQSHYLMNVCGVAEAMVSFYLGAILK